MDVQCKKCSNKYELENLIHNDLFNSTIDLYIKKVSDEYNETRSIPAAPSRFTTIIPKEGLEIIVGQEDEFASINYQIF